MARADTLPLRPIRNVPWTEIARRTWTKAQKDDAFGRAAALAYFFLFSIFPLLIVLTSFLGLTETGREIWLELLRYLRTILPLSAYDLIASTIREIVESSGGGKVSFGIALTIASASSGMVAIIEGLNSAYDVTDGRSWLRMRGLAILLTLMLSGLSIVALAIFIYGNELGIFVASRIGHKAAFEIVWPWVQWPLASLVVLLALTMTYRFAPSVPVRNWKRHLPGAVLALALWIGASIGLRTYLRFFDTYRTGYGSLGALMILMVWFYLFGVAILSGGELNSVLEGANEETASAVPALEDEEKPTAPRR